METAETNRTTPSDNPSLITAPKEAAIAPAPPTAGVTDPTPRLISGIDLVDYSGGGLQPEKAYLVKGGVGLGKSIIGLQFLSRGLELGEPGILITNQRPDSVLLQAKSLGFTLDEAVRRGQLLILNTSNRYFDLVESPADVMAIIDELGDYIRDRNAQRLVIDPVFALITTTYSNHFAIAVTQSLLNALEELPVTTLLLAGDDTLPEHTPILRVLEQNVAGVIALHEDRATGGRLMRLSKFRYGTTDSLSAHYRILNGRGIINYQGEGENVVDVTKPWEEGDTARRTVLVLGSNPDTIRKVKEALGDRYEVFAEPDISRGVERVKNERPGLVLVTPARSIQAISAIVDLSRNSSSSIAFLSPSQNRGADKVLYLRAGADDFITEPFSPAELQARVDALIRRSGRRLVQRDSSINTISSDELQNLLSESAARSRTTEVMKSNREGVAFDSGFREKLSRSIDTVSKLDMNFALYWIKSNDNGLNKTLAKLCRQEDILCRNANGEFVALLAATDENGVKGFESRLRERIPTLDQYTKGYALYTPGEPIENFTSRALGGAA